MLVSKLEHLTKTSRSHAQQDIANLAKQLTNRDTLKNKYLKVDAIEKKLKEIAKGLPPSLVVQQPPQLQEQQQVEEEEEDERFQVASLKGVEIPYVVLWCKNTTKNVWFNKISLKIVLQR